MVFTKHLLMSFIYSVSDVKRQYLNFLGNQNEMKNTGTSGQSCSCQCVCLCMSLTVAVRLCVSSSIIMAFGRFDHTSA